MRLLHIYMSARLLQNKNAWLKICRMYLRPPMLSFVQHAPQSLMDLCARTASAFFRASPNHARCAHFSCNADLYMPRDALWPRRNLTEVCTDGFVGHLNGSWWMSTRRWCALVTLKLTAVECGFRDMRKAFFVSQLEPCMFNSPRASLVCNWQNEVRIYPTPLLPSGLKAKDWATCGGTCLPNKQHAEWPSDQPSPSSNCILSAPGH